MRTQAALVAFAWLAFACATPTSEPEDSTSTSTSTSSETSSMDSESTDDPGTELDDPCDCAEDELCVGTCQVPDFGTPSVHDLRCMDAQLCPDEDLVQCLHYACGSAYFHFISSCGDAEGASIDLFCSEYASAAECDPLGQDCPENEKCVMQLSDNEFLTEKSKCVAITGTDPLGAPCTSEGAGEEAGGDSCDSSGMCWSGAPSAAPFEGVCQPFCVMGMMCADEGMVCGDVAGDGSFYLCT